jgi:50S ribosomal protein L16 3-hydroxylase
MWQLQGLDSAEFIKHYWQKRPCVLRNAFTDFESPVSPEELAGLACEEDVHCRLVIENAGENAEENAGGSPWQVRYGPFEEQDFLELPETHYSLLVSECEKWIPELTSLLDQFRFIPDWRIDDLMISYAPPDSSVGPHVDAYDVFLLQVMGSRRWLFCDSPSEDPEHIPGLELAILQQFTPDQELLLNVGDMLYLPPGFAHHGVALDHCMTYSIGFRAPTATTALESFALESERLGMKVERYTDAELELDRHHAEITDTEIERFKSLASELLQQPQSLWQDAVGKMLSDSAVVAPENPDQPIYISDLQSSAWLRHPETRLFYHRSANSIEVYYNGRVHELPREQKVLDHLQQLCEHREWSAALINACIEIESLEVLLLELASNGAIIPAID